MNIPNTLTLLRIALIPCFIVLFWAPAAWTHLAAAAVFGLAAITDWLDGYLARKLGQTSPLGAFLDPVADKLIVAVVLILLLQRDPRIAIALPVAIIIGREITVSALREWMAALGARKTVAVSGLGKIKTTAQMIAIPLLLYQVDLAAGLNAQEIGTWLIYAAAFLTLWSMVYYLKAAIPQAIDYDQHS